MLPGDPRHVQRAVVWRRGHVLILPAAAAPAGRKVRQLHSRRRRRCSAMCTAQAHEAAAVAAATALCHVLPGAVAGATAACCPPSPPCDSQSACKWWSQGLQQTGHFKFVW